MSDAGPAMTLLQRTAEDAGLRCVVGAAIVDSSGRVSVPRRAAAARLLPGLWDVVGGHVDLG